MQNVAKLLRRRPHRQRQFTHGGDIDIGLQHRHLCPLPQEQVSRVVGRVVPDESDMRPVQLQAGSRRYQLNDRNIDVQRHAARQLTVQLRQLNATQLRMRLVEAPDALHGALLE
jgi:hypothetical protein